MVEREFLIIFFTIIYCCYFYYYFLFTLSARINFYLHNITVFFIFIFILIFYLCVDPSHKKFRFFKQNSKII